MAACNTRVSRCESLLNESNTALIDWMKVSQAKDNEINTLDSELKKKDQVVFKDEAELDSWYHNPVILVGLGLLVGGAAGSYLAHH